MSALKQALLDALSGIEGLEARPSKVAGGTALFHRGREFAHFHHDTELDLRLTRPVIRSLGLAHPPDSMQHPRRSPSSHWIEVRLGAMADVPQVVRLVEAAIARL